MLRIREECDFRELDMLAQEIPVFFALVGESRLAKGLGSGKAFHILNRRPLLLDWQPFHSHDEIDLRDALSQRLCLLIRLGIPKIL